MPYKDPAKKKVSDRAYFLKHHRATAETPQEAEAVKALQAKGYIITKEPPRAREINVFRGRFDKTKPVRFAAFSCSHLGSRHQQVTALKAFYQRAYDEGCSHVLCCGDVTEGNGHVYRGQEYEVFIHGYDAQLQYAAEHFPAIKGLETVVIAGNHDTSFYAHEGADIVQALAEKRPDMQYLGQRGGHVHFGPLYVYLLHADGGGAYARSYKSQKMIEQFAPEKKPDMLFIGHYHTFCHIPQYRNVIGWQLGCFQSQTVFEKQKGLFPEVGGLIVEVGLGDNDRPGGIVYVKHQHIPFYIPREKDW